MLVRRLVSPCDMCQSCVRFGSRRSVTSVCHGLTAAVKWLVDVDTLYVQLMHTVVWQLVPTLLDATCTLLKRLLLVTFQQQADSS